MKLNSPVLIGWQHSDAARFVRRHRWFFGKNLRPFDFRSPFMAIFIFAVPAFSLLAFRDTLRSNAVWAFLFLVIVMGYILTVSILLLTALELKDDKENQ